MTAILRLLAVAAASAAALLGGAGPALAGPPTPPSTLTPTVNCIATGDQIADAGYGDAFRNSGSTRYAVLGYTNSGTSKVTVKEGPSNQLVGLYGIVPTDFAPGTQFGQGLAILSSSTSKGSWTLNGKSAAISMTAAAACQADEMPAEGNGLGAPIALLLSVPIGVAATVYAKRRRTR